MNSRLNPRDQMLCIRHRPSVHIRGRRHPSTSQMLTEVPHLASLTFNLRFDAKYTSQRDFMYYDKDKIHLMNCLELKQWTLSLSVDCQSHVSRFYCQTDAFFLVSFSPCSRSLWSYHGSSSSVTNSSILPARSISYSVNGPSGRSIKTMKINH